MKRFIPSALVITFFSLPAFGQDYLFKTEKDFDQPADSKSIEVLTAAMKESPFSEVELDPKAAFVLDQMDQVWITDDASQAILIKTRIGLEDQNLTGKLLRYEDGYLANGTLPNGTPFVAYFHQMKEDSAKRYFNRMHSLKSARLYQEITDSILPQMAQAKALPESCKEAKNSLTDLKTNIKNGFKGSRWKCFKSFVVAKSGNFFNAIVEKVLDFKNGSIWKKAKNSLKFFQGILGSLGDPTVLKNFVDLQFLKNKKQADVICSALGETSRSTQSLVNSGEWNSSFLGTIKEKFKEVLQRMTDRLRPEIEQGKRSSPILMCSNQVQEKVKEVKTVADEVQNTIKNAVDNGKKAR
jgi:hypothetical protein